MNKVLQRAMFNTPKHEHQSTGIASGLEYRPGYRVGGRVGFDAGGFDTAANLAQGAAGTQANIAGGLGSLGQMAQQGAFGDVGQLFQMGEAQRQIQAAQNLAQYQTPFYGLGQYAGALRGTPNVGTQYQTPNPILTGLQYGIGSSMMGG